MSEYNKSILEKANQAIKQGDNEGFLSFCTDDTTWNFIGDKVLSGKQEVREWMKEGYKEPPRFTVSDMIAEADHVIAIGTIQQQNEDGEDETYRYCDVWKFRNGLMCGLEAFVIKS